MFPESARACLPNSKSAALNAKLFTGSHRSVTLTRPPFRNFSGAMSGLYLGACLPNLKFVSLTVLELLAFNAQKITGSRDPGHAPFFEIFFWGHVGTFRGSMRAKLEVNIFSSKMAKDTNFKFGTYAPREKCADMTPEKIFRKAGVARVTLFRKLLGINGNSSKMAKDSNSNLARMLPGRDRTECLKIYFRKGAWPSSRDPVNCRALSANSHKMVEAIHRTDFKFVSVPMKHV